ncbi:MAG: hypothetical protein JSS29_13835 [Proteobacteria bacterium]|nr:hypothetical protein [Pseudomonadota bacterium]
MRAAPITFHASVTGSSNSQVSWSVLNGTQPVPGLISASGALQPITDCALLGARLTVQATSVASPAAVGSASVSVQIGAVNPATITVPTNETLVFAATDLPCGNNSTDLPPSGYQWSITGGAAGGTLGPGPGNAVAPSAFVMYTAPAAIGTYALNVTLRESTRSAAITVAQPVSYTGTMQLCRSGHTATLLATGAVLLVGEGGDYTGIGGCGAPPSAPPSAVPAATAELFDPVTSTFAPTALPIYPNKHAHAATLLKDGRVLLTGGIDSGVSSVHAEIYDPATGAYTATGDMTQGHSYHATAALADGRVVIVGDWPAGAPPEIYDPSAGAFTALTNAGSCCAPFSTATLLNSGEVLIAGGGFSSGAETAYLLDASAHSLVQTGSLNQGRLGHTATLLGNGKVLVVGGIEQAYLFQSQSTGGSISQTAELYDPATGKFTMTSGAMRAPRALHSAAMLPDGRVLIVGGVLQLPAQYDEFDGQDALLYYQFTIYNYATEIYDPATDQFSAGPVIPARVSPTTTTLLSGHLLIAGGGPLAAELY